VFDGKMAIQDDPFIHITKLSQLPDVVFPEKVTTFTRNRTICFMSFALNYYFGGLDTFGYHLVNVIIHILNGLTLFLLSYTILTLPFHEGKERENALMIAFLGSFIWLVHPIQSQAVSYIYQRMTSLTTLFYLLSLLCYIKGRLQHSYTRLAFFVLSLLSGLLALFTKQNAATLPLFIILSEIFFFQPFPFKVGKKKLGFLLLFAGLFILIAGIYLRSDFISRIALGYGKRGWTPLERVLTEWRVVIFYLSLLVYPHPSRLNLDHDFALSHSLFSPFTTFLSLSIIIGLFTLAIFLMRKNRLVSFAIFWFLGNLVIESSIIPLELVFEHRLYLPSMGLIIVVTALCVSLLKRRGGNWVVGVSVLLILLFSYWTYERASVWREPLSLWMDAAKKSPNKARPHNNLGIVYGKKGMIDEAISEYKKAIAIKPNYVEAHYNFGRTHAEMHRFDEAISEYKKALVINPNHAEARTNLGVAYREKGRVDEAISEYKKALTINPNLVEAHYNLGNAYHKKGAVDEAISQYKKVLTINPNHAGARSNLGIVYRKKGRVDEAISEHKKVLTINPNHVEARSNLGIAYRKKGRLDEAISELKKVIAAHPKHIKAHYNLGIAYREKGMLDKAIPPSTQILQMRISTLGMFIMKKVS
jgi:tetratricopeptide (TPR) repeat protein